MEIQDPIHGAIEIAPGEVKVMDSMVFQRLRSIKQLGFSEYSFPGATHNRYIHSVGVCHLAGKLFDSIFRHYKFSKNENRERFRQIVRLGALLHDIGHGPLSHTTEEVMPALRDLNVTAYKNLRTDIPIGSRSHDEDRRADHELLWFLSGDTNIKYLKDNGVRIWDEWADEKGDLGPVYGKQWRSWQTPDGRTIDQIKNVVASLKNNPDSRRHMVVAFNPSDVDQMALPPCHAFFQFYVAKGKLSCQLYQRSADVFLGVPFNIASYALLTMMMAQVCNLEPGEFIHTFGDAHLYANHLDQARLQLTRQPYPLPTMKINPKVKDIFSFKFEDFELCNYEADPHIKAEVSV